MTDQTPLRTHNVPGRATSGEETHSGTQANWQEALSWPASPVLGSSCPPSETSVDEYLVEEAGSQLSKLPCRYSRLASSQD